MALSKRQQRLAVVAKKRAKGKLRKHKDFSDLMTDRATITMPKEFMTGQQP